MSVSNKLLVISIVAVILITIGSYTYVFAEDSIDSMSFYHKDNPTTCIMTPEPDLQDEFHNGLLLLTFDTIREWETTMTEYTSGTKLHVDDGWHIPVLVINYERHFDKLASHFPQCNIFIEYSKENTGQHIDNKNALGWTSINFANSAHQWTYIMLYIEGVEKNPSIKICIGCSEEQRQEQEDKLSKEDTVVPFGDKAIRNILIHEFAHALGVGHYVDDRTKFNNVSSLMYPMMNPFDTNALETIPILDKEVVRQIYNNDGFKGFRGQEFTNYTINELLIGAIDNLVEKIK